MSASEDLPCAAPAGRVVSIHIAVAAGGDLNAVMSVEAVKDVGLVGDRYAAGKGSFSRWPGSGRAVTMIESEVIDAVPALKPQ